jgi:hypothetical protein
VPSFLFMSPTHTEILDQESRPNLEVLREFVKEKSFESVRGEVESALSWLETLTPGMPAVHPSLRSEYALHATMTSVSDVSRRFRVDRHSLARTIRDVVTALVYHGEVKNSNLPSEIEGRIQLLETAARKSEEADTLVRSEAFSPLFSIAPHVRELSQAFILLGTPRYHLEAVEVPFSPDQLRSVERFLLEPGDTETLHGFTPLARRYLFAKWLTKDPLYKWGEQADKRVGEGAKYILESSGEDYSHADANRFLTMRHFLREMMQQEYRNVARRHIDPHYVVQYFFPNAEGKLARNAEDIDALRAYKRFYETGTIPETIKTYARSVINAEPQMARITRILPGKYFSNEWRKQLDWAGLKFLENILADQSIKLDDDIFTRDVGRLIREAKIHAKLR